MSHGSRGRIQRRKSRLAALRVESLEERRLLSASRSAAHAAGQHHLDAPLAADVSTSLDSNKHDAPSASPGKGVQALSESVDKIKPAKVGHAVGHAVLGEPPGAVVSSQAMQLSSMDRPSDGPSPGRGLALGHLISKHAHDKPDNLPTKSLPANSAAQTKQDPVANATPGSPSISSKSILDEEHDSGDAKINRPASWRVAGTSQIIAAAPQYWWNDQSSSGKPTSSPVASKPAATPSKPNGVKIIAAPSPPRLESTTSKMVIDEEGDKHNVLVKASSEKASWSISSQPKRDSQAPSNPSKSPPSKSPPVKSTDNPEATSPIVPVKSILSPTASSRPALNKATPSPSLSSLSSPPGPQIGRSTIASPSDNVNVHSDSTPGHQTITAPTTPFDPSQAAIASQDEVKQVEMTEEAEAPAAVQTPPDSPTPPVDPAADPQSSLEEPRSHDGQQAKPLDAPVVEVVDEELGCSELDSADNAERAATAMAGLWATVATSDPGSLLAKACDALAENLPVDAAALDDALADLLDELEDLGNDLASSLAQAGVSPWIAAASLGAAAGTAHRRRQRHRAKRKLGTRAAVLKQFPELLGLVPRGDA